MDGDGAARSGPIGDDGSTTLATTVQGAGTLAFRWRTSSEWDFDWLRLRVDGNEYASMSGWREWEDHALEIEAMFAKDKGVEVERNDATRTVKLRVADAKKADALARLLQPEYAFGGVTLRVVVIPGNSGGEPLPKDAKAIDLITAAFEDNPIVTQIRPVSKGLFRDLVYCVFAKEVVQISADNLADINGNKSTLWEDIARELFASSEVLYCTSAGRLCDGFGDAPLGDIPVRCRI